MARDGLVRRCIKAVARWRYQIDLGATRLLRRLQGEAPDVELAGNCNGCGACCETPTIHLNRWLFHARSVRWFVLTWHRRVNGFEHIGQDRSQHTFIFRCTHYDPVTRQCDSYASRPGMCRDYPRNLLDLPAPELLPECSYCIRATNADAIRDSLRELDLPPEKLAELERKFHVASRPPSHTSESPPDPPTAYPPTAA